MTREQQERLEEDAYDYAASVADIDEDVWDSFWHNVDNYWNVTDAKELAERFLNYQEKLHAEGDLRCEIAMEESND